MPGVALIGFMGAGKSTTGSLLAERLGWPFVDLDEQVEVREGCSIPELFERGEEHFREAEHQALRELVARPESFVLATGGGAPIPPRNQRLLRSWGRVVFLDAPLSVLAERVGRGEGRPNWSRAEALYAARRPVYEQADRVLDARRSPEELVDELEAWLC